jgi:hypothetical protein
MFFQEDFGEGGTKFIVEEGSCGAIRFKNPRSGEAVIPSGISYEKYDFPFTAHGFTSGKNGRIGIPEWHLQKRLELQEGDEIWEIFHDGSEKLRAVYKFDNGKLKFVEIK